jgi:hypothetical protein
MISAGPAPLANLDALAAPTASTDATLGYAAGSLWREIATNALWFCTDATAGAAVWVPLQPAPFGYASARWYSGLTSAQGNAAAVPAVDTMYAHPMLIRERVAVSTLGIRVAATAGTGSAVKMAVYAANRAGRPVGAPVLSNNSGAATTTINADVPLAVSGILQPGAYFGVTRHTGSPLPQCIAVAGTDHVVESLLGRAALNSSITLSGLSLASTYSAAWPTLTGAESWTEVNGTVGVPLLRFLAA